MEELFIFFIYRLNKPAFIFFNVFFASQSDCYYAKLYMHKSAANDILSYYSLYFYIIIANHAMQ
jgi:hypothetical protein